MVEGRRLSNWVILVLMGEWNCDCRKTVDVTESADYTITQWL